MFLLPWENIVNNWKSISKWLFCIETYTNGIGTNRAEVRIKRKMKVRIEHSKILNTY